MNDGLVGRVAKRKIESTSFAGNEARRTFRRSTLAEVEIVEGRYAGSEVLATNLSADGAFLKAEHEFESGTSIRLQIRIPAQEKSVDVLAKVVRISPTGVGVRFEKLTARDRSRLRSYSGYYETDEAIVRLQRGLGNDTPGNLLPISDQEDIWSILTTASEAANEVRVVFAGRIDRSSTARIRKVVAADEKTTINSGRVILEGVTPTPPKDAEIAYLVFGVASFQYMCEAIVIRTRPALEVVAPERVYVSERRSRRRESNVGVEVVFQAHHLEGRRSSFPVVDQSGSGASILVPSTFFLVPGTRFPYFVLKDGGVERRIMGASVRHVTRTDRGLLRVGLKYEEDDEPQVRSHSIQKRMLQTSLGDNFRRYMHLVRRNIARLLTRAASDVGESVEVVRYGNKRGEQVAAIVDANFDTGDTAVRPDVAIVIAPAVLKRKEAFTLLARTLIDNFDREKIKAVVLRFDACHVIGESAMNADLVEQGRPYYHWTLGHLRDDIEASIRYLEKRFRPIRRALISISLSAIPARKVVADPPFPIELWVAPFGCPDAQDMLRNYLAGQDHFPSFERGEGPTAVMIHSRPVCVETFYGSALEDRMAYLDDGKADLRRIDTPVTWITGKHDYWVTHSRVREMLAAPTSAIREIFEVPTGHVLKGGSEVIELFKLVTESVQKHLFGNDRPAQDPKFSVATRQSDHEWSRVKKATLENPEAFWREHLFGSHQDDLGYDIILEHPDYGEFLRDQVKLMDLSEGQDIVDLGCGTGNLAVEMVRAYDHGGQPNSISLVDLLGEAVDVAATKVRSLYDRRKEEEPPVRTTVMNLEVSRLAPVDEFLRGRLWSVEELCGRVEGLDKDAAESIQQQYGKELHAILRGRPVSRREIEQRYPAFTEHTVDVVLDLGRAARFLTHKTVPQDLKPNFGQEETTGNVDFLALSFGNSTRELELELPTSGFDRVGASLLIPYLYDAGAFTREMYRVLRPGGVLVASSIRPQYDPSKVYAEAADLVRREGNNEQVRRKLVALRHFGNMVGKLIELEDDGRFHFHSKDELYEIARSSGFSTVHVVPAFGNPPNTLILRARK